MKSLFDLGLSLDVAKLKTIQGQYYHNIFPWQFILLVIFLFLIRSLWNWHQCGRNVQAKQHVLLSILIMFTIEYSATFTIFFRQILYMYIHPDIHLCVLCIQKNSSITSPSLPILLCNGVDLVSFSIFWVSIDMLRPLCTTVFVVSYGLQKLSRFLPMWNSTDIWA